MARIRSIHPSLFTDEDYMSLSPYAMAAWPGVWVEADDNGVFEWKPLTLKARLLPCASIDMVDVLAEYESRGMVRRFSVAGKDYGAIRNFRKFQRPEKPKAWHPLPDELREFVALPPTVPQSVADQSPTPPRKSPQMEDVGGRMEENTVANATGAAVAEHPAKTLFDSGVRIITAVGRSEREARSIIGQLRKARGDPDAAKVMASAAHSSEPVEFIQAAIANRGRSAPPRKPGQTL